MLKTPKDSPQLFSPKMQIVKAVLRHERIGGPPGQTWHPGPPGSDLILTLHTAGSPEPKGLSGNLDGEEGSHMWFTSVKEL